MADRIVKITDDFWNIRGTFRVAGVVDIGTQASVVRKRDGRFVMLDAYTLKGPILEAVNTLTDNGETLDAILNLHPFHTLHVEAVHKAFPKARLIGSERHVRKAPDLPWDDRLIDDPALQAEFADDLQLKKPLGVDFISDDENVHFSSILAYHPTSGTIHVDDTLTYMKVPVVGGLIGKPDVLSFHPTLGKALEDRPGAAGDFRAWAKELAADWGDARHLCAAHMRNLDLDADPPRDTPIGERILRALERVEGTLKKHEDRHG